MKKLVQVVWSGTSITMIALAIVIGGTATTQNTNAFDGSTATDDNAQSIEREQSTTTNNERETLRSQQRAELEAKKQELRAAQEAAKAQLEAERAANRATRQEKLSASKLEICKNREANINNRISRIADRSTKHLALFNQISERAQAFYLNKGNTLTNYDALVNDAAEKKTAAEAAVQTIVETTANFDCEGDNPKVTIEEFKISLKSSIEVLKEYRTSVKNLIVGIKSVNGTTTSDGSEQSEGTQ